MLLFRESIPSTWVTHVMADLLSLLVDHAHLERKAATPALNLEKYRLLFDRVHELNAVAIEEFQHYGLVHRLLQRRGIPFAEPQPSPWTKGLIRSIRNGVQGQVIDRLVVCALNEGRSCDKFQALACALAPVDPELGSFY